MNFDELGEKLKDTQEGYDNQGRSYFVDVLISLKPKCERSLLSYDAAIREYVEKLKSNRTDTNFNLKYFQYLAVLFTEIFLDKYYNNKQQFLDELNEFLKDFNNENRLEVSYFTEDNFRKLAFWMATGSGKTLIMHINYWQIMKYSGNKWDNIILITTNEGLSVQHYEELKLSGIDTKLYTGNIDNLKTRDEEILVIDIYKLTSEKKGKGLSVDISYFDGKNLVFIDEGHKGQKAEEQKWKKLREEIGKNGFLLEYSATFGQVIGVERQRGNNYLNDEYTTMSEAHTGGAISSNKDLYDEYTKAIIFDYSYKHFYDDCYGKDFYIYNIKTNGEVNKEIYSEEQETLLLMAGLLSFYEQLIIFEKHNEELREYNIEKPLWIFVGGKVVSKGVDSDVLKLIQFLDKIIKDEHYLEENIKKILNGNSALIDSHGNDVFEGKFEFIRHENFQFNFIINNIYQKVFGGKGILELFEIKNAEGEIGLKVSTAKDYFGVINVGDLNSLKKLILQAGIEVKNDYLSQSLFFGINKMNSPINILIGSKKFVEGWNSWRVSNMGLLNMGRGEGPQIIQLFGRGVRLRGTKGNSLKREKNPDYKLKVLQTLFIFGLNADYINSFLKAMENEEARYKEITIPIRYNSLEKWEGKIYTIKTKEDFDFINYPLKLTIDQKNLNNIVIDLRPKITLTHEFNFGTVQSMIDEPSDIPDEYFKIIDWNYLYSEIVNYKTTKGMYNLMVDSEAIMQIVKSGGYKIFLDQTAEESTKNNNKPIFTIHSFNEVKQFQDIILMVLKEYLNRFYSKEKKRKTMNYLEAEPLTIKGHTYMYPEEGKITLKIPESLNTDIMNVMKQLKIYCSGAIPANWKPGKSFILDLNNHLYTPLIIWMKNKDEIKSMPVKLNKGETDFVHDFEVFIDKNRNVIKNNEVFLLRNLSRKGVGFFLDSGFYPDFIIWIKKENKQHIIFIDPKGIRNLGNFKDEKIQLCGSYIKEIEQQINKELDKNGVKENLQLDSFILSVTSYNDIKNIFNERNSTIDDFWKHNVVFQEENDYIKRIFEQVGALSKK